MHPHADRPADARPARADEIERVLRGSSWPAVRELRVRAEQGVVWLSGHVRSYYEKQVAVRAVQGLPGVRQVVDQVEVYYG